MIEEIESNEKTIEQDLSFAQSEQWQFTVTPIENTVIEKAAKGDEKAFEEVFMCTYRYVFAAVKKYLKNLKKPIDKTFKIHYNMLVSYKDTHRTHADVME